jgi:TolA-binding protein
MDRYNLNTIAFLVNSFTDIIDSFGTTNNSIVFYKRQVENMVNMRQVSISDKELVEELLGIQNTNNIKWSVADEKLRQFKSSVAMLSDIRDLQSARSMIHRLSDNRLIGKSVEKVLLKIYA